MENSGVSTSFIWSSSADISVGKNAIDKVRAKANGWALPLRCEAVGALRVSRLTGGGDVVKSSVTKGRFSVSGPSPIILGSLRSISTAGGSTLRLRQKRPPRRAAFSSCLVFSPISRNGRLRGQAWCRPFRYPRSGSSGSPCGPGRCGQRLQAAFRNRRCSGRRRCGIPARGHTCA
jgi:hypothetical protein